jgi:alanine-synthesizing transaminase
VTSPIRPSARTKNVHYAVRDILKVADEARRAGREMLYLNIGDPCPFGFAPPAALLEATQEAMRANKNVYAPSDGIPAALRSIRADAERRGIRDIVHTCVGSGGSEVIEMALAALLDPGENVLTPSPGYPLYTAVMAKLGAENRPYFLDEENGWQPDLEDLRAKVDAKTRAIVLINPNNPTGSVCTRETLQGLVDLCAERGLVLFADEIYDRLLFDGLQHVSAASLSRDAAVITICGLSKNWVVPGWRIGWGVISGPAAALGPWVEAIEKLERSRLSANHPEQYAIPVALDGPNDHLPGLVKELELRRDKTVEMLSAIEGITITPPRAAFYAFPRLHIDEPDEIFIADLIRATGVVVVPGSGFGQRPGTKHFRIVTLPPVDQLAEAYRRIEAFLHARKKGRVVQPS